MQQGLTIVKLTEERFDDFINLIEKLAEYEKLDPPDDKAKIRLKKDGLSENPKYEAYLGIVDGKAVAYIIFFMTYSSFLALPTLHLEDIFVLKKYRRRKIGQKMFEFVVKQAKERKCGRMEWCVLAWNKPAIKFYKKNKAKRLNWYFYRLTKDEIERFPNLEKIN
jgi:GNAT superfamily N-acetyltransferase